MGENERDGEGEREEEGEGVGDGEWEGESEWEGDGGWDGEGERDGESEWEGDGEREGDGEWEENDVVKGMGKDGEGGGLVKEMVKVKDRRWLRKYSHSGPQDDGGAELSERHIVYNDI